MNPAIRLCVAAIMMLSLSCSGSDGGNSPGGIDPDAECGINWKNKYVYDEMQDRYLWYDRVPDNLDPTSFESPQDLLEAAVADVDRWSAIVSAERYNQIREQGIYQGMGCALEFDADHHLWVRFVYAGSQADEAGIKRTDRIISINDRSVAAMQDMRAVVNEMRRNPTAIVEFRAANGNVTTVNLGSAQVTMKTVLHRQVLSNGGTKVGYLVFQSFIPPAVAELDEAFAFFRQQGIDDLILDLRYNTGGSGKVAQHLASLIGGDQTNGEVFQKLVHNNRHSEHDWSILFEMPDNALGLQRLFVISTDDTCSASEIIINGLKPYIQVIQIGSTTCGKPVGMYATEFCDLVMLPIHFRFANADDEGGYFDGLAPTCTAEDDLSRPFGDVQEDSLKTALSFISNGTCPDLARAAGQMQSVPAHVNDLWGIWREIGAF